MRYREIVPPPSLRPLVHRIWVLQGEAEAEAEFQRAMPDGRPEIIFNLADRFESRGPGGPERQPEALLVGPTTRAIELRPTGRVDLLGLRLQPGAAPALLRAFGARAAWIAHRGSRRPAAGLDERPRRAARRMDRTAERVELVRTTPRPSRRAMRTATRGSRPASRWCCVRAEAVGTGRIADLVGLSPRHLSRLCRERVGMGPKLLGRLTRFQRVLRELEQGTRPRWAAMAQRHGYFDQAHLGRRFPDVRRGRRPGATSRRRGR